MISALCIAAEGRLAYTDAFSPPNGAYYEIELVRGEALVSAATSLGGVCLLRPRSKDPKWPRQY